MHSQGNESTKKIILVFNDGVFIDAISTFNILGGRKASILACMLCSMNKSAILLEAIPLD